MLDAVLKDYINLIRENKKPKWDSEAKLADSIREDRNLVHARLCLRSNTKIDKDKCEKAIKDLDTIIDSRWKIE